VRVLKIFKKPLEVEFKAEFKNGISGFLVAKMTAEEKQAKGNAMLYLKKIEGGTQYFISILPQEDSASLTVECGWKPLDEKFYALPIDALSLLDEARDRADMTIAFRVEKFTTRLFWLCNRGRLEEFWSMLATVSWNPGSRTDHSKFWREYNENVYENQRKYLGKGYPEGFAEPNAKLVSTDVIYCIKTYGVPFLEEAIAYHRDHSFGS